MYKSKIVTHMLKNQEMFSTSCEKIRQELLPDIPT